MLLQKITNPDKSIVQKTELTDFLKKRLAEHPEPVVILTVGAGDIDRLVPQLEKELGNE
jgi:UDP-N-acetylmuramate-alanine ligase